MRRTSKKKLQESASGDCQILQIEAEGTPIPQTKESLKAQIIEIIDSGRRSALEVVSEMMCITFEEIIELLRANEVNGEELLKEKIFLSNVSTYSLSAMLSESRNGSLRDYLIGKSKSSFMMSFLDIRTLSKEALQSEYKKAFEKWTLEEEMILTGMYNEGKSWKEISEHLQRNINAIKIRVEKLGLAVDTGAKKRY
ncbi:MAG: hypothetical protein MJZ16_08765 [Bacteroidales bacterium]|nr:hypothetical protein [Bacteroidales bacterium]